jgi:activator of HSP90 ATPase
MCRIEKDCTEWSHADLKQRLLQIKTRPFEVTKVSSVSGEVSVSQRKGKIRYLFDLLIKFEWTHESGDSGAVEIQDFMPDTDLKGFEFYVRSMEGGNCSAKTKALANTVLRDETWKALQKFASDLVEHHGQTLLVSENNTENHESLEAESKSAERFTTSDSHRISHIHTSNAHNVLCKTWNGEVTFQASPEDIFEVLTRPEKVQIWSRNPVKGSLSEPNRTFALFGGSVVGKVISCQANSIEWTWKLSDWAVESHVLLNICKGSSGETKVSIIQKGIPSDQFDAITENWSKYYWNPIKTVFGYGTFIQQ